MPTTTTIAASGVPSELVKWLDEQAQKNCTNRSTIIRQILLQHIAEESATDQEHNQKEAT